MKQNTEKITKRKDMRDDRMYSQKRRKRKNSRKRKAGMVRRAKI